MKTFAEKNYSKPVPIDDSVVIDLDEMWYFLHTKKDKFGFGKHIAEQQKSSLIGNAAHEILKHLEKCTSDKKMNVKVFFSDRYRFYRDFMPRQHLNQTEETHLIESVNFTQRHWFARFRRKTCCVSRSLKMIDLTMFLYAAVHVNKSIGIVI